MLAHLAKGKKALQHWLVSGRGQALRTRSPEGGLGTSRSSGFRPLRRSPATLGAVGPLCEIAKSVLCAVMKSKYPEMEK